MDTKLVEQIIKALKTNPEVVAAYFIGSFAKGQARKESDFDLVVVVDRKSAGVENKIYDLLRTVSFPRNLDLSVVDKTTSPLFLFQIVRDREKIYVRENSHLARFEAFVLHNYYDNAHIRNIYASYLAQKFPYAS